MIAISMPGHAQAGKHFCATVTGATGSIDARVLVDGRSVPFEVEQTGSERKITFKIPIGARESIQVYVADSLGSDAEDNALIS